MNVIFLDLDDVLVTADADAYAREYLFGVRQLSDMSDSAEVKAVETHLIQIAPKIFNKRAVETLKQVCKLFKPKIIMSTSWGQLLKEDEFKTLFDRAGLNFIELYAPMPLTLKKMSSYRCHEIAWTANKLPKDAKFVALDDTESGHSFLGMDDEYLLDRVIFCNINEEGEKDFQGLRPFHIDKIAQFLDPI